MSHDDDICKNRTSFTVEHSRSIKKSGLLMPDKRNGLIQQSPLKVSLMVGVWTGRGAWYRGGSMDRGGAGRHSRAQLACLKAPQQFLIGATQTLLLIAFLLHVHLQVSIVFRELSREDMRGILPCNSAICLSKAKGKLPCCSYTCICL